MAVDYSNEEGKTGCSLDPKIRKEKMERQGGRVQ